MNVSYYRVLFITFFALSLPLFVHAAAFPNVQEHPGIAMDTPANYEPSGLTWNPINNHLFVVSDDGKVSRMNMNGSNQEIDIPRRVGIGTDFEAITMLDPQSPIVYIGLEHPDSILEYNWETKEFAAKSWNLTEVLTGPDNSGLEGLTFVPNQYLPDGMNDSQTGGLFYAAIQRTPVAGGDVHDDYLIYAFDIDVNQSGVIRRWWGIPVAPNTPTSDISDLFFSKDTGILYVLYDGANRLVEMNPQGLVLRDYSNVPVVDQEGVVIVTHYPEQGADIYFASDTGKMLGWYSLYPVTYYDADQDGGDMYTDCNDNDASITELQTFYEDSDGDGLGSDVSMMVCSMAAPEGYVENSDDINDLVSADEVSVVLDDLVVNGDMSTDQMGPWIRYGQPFLIEKAWYELKVPNSSQVMHIVTEGGGGIQQLGITVIPGHTYELSYEAFVVSGGSIAVRLGNHSSNSDFENAQQYVGRTGGFVTKTRRFVAPETNDFRLVFATRGATELYIDNVSIIEVNPANILLDPEFEASSPWTWMRYGADIRSKSSDVVSSGRYSMHLVMPVGTGAGIQQTNLALEAGRTYRLTLNYAMTRGRVSVRLGNRSSNVDFQAADPAFADVIGASYFAARDGVWYTYTREFIAPESTDFRVVISGRGADAYIDSVTLIQVGI